MGGRGWKSRKIIIFFVLLVFSSVAYWLNKMTAGEWIGFAEWLFGLYCLGNVGQKALLSYFNKKAINGDEESAQK